jgi:hypothetical protein
VAKIRPQAVFLLDILGTEGDDVKIVKVGSYSVDLALDGIAYSMMIM